LIVGVLLIACGGPTAPGPAMPARSATTTAAPARAAAVTAPTIDGPLTVFSAASLTDAFGEIGAMIAAANPGSTITFNFAGSPALRAQLREGARADLLAVADEPTMQAARQEGTIDGAARLFVQNRLVVVVARQRADQLTNLKDLARPGLKLVLAQAAVPVGNYARQALARMSGEDGFGADFHQRVQANVVSEEANVRQMVTKVQLGEADAGIVYASDVTPGLRQLVAVVAIPDRFNVIASYPIAPVRGAANPTGASAFIDYLLSPAGQAVLQRWGFIPVGPVAASGQPGEATAGPAPGAAGSAASGRPLAGAGAVSSHVRSRSPQVMMRPAGRRRWRLAL
jgi:molybdate transport system substrate-binding protein